MPSLTSTGSGVWSSLYATLLQRRWPKEIDAVSAKDVREGTMGPARRTRPAGIDGEGHDQERTSTSTRGRSLPCEPTRCPVPQAVYVPRRLNEGHDFFQARLR